MRILANTGCNRGKIEINVEILKEIDPWGIDMLKDLLLNACVLIASVSVGNQLFINKELTPSSPWKLRVLIGVLSGLLGITLMLNTVHIIPGVILDFRNLGTILSALYCGPIAALVSGCLIALFRCTYFGVSTSSVLSALTSVVIATGCGILAVRLKSKRKKWLYLSLYTNVVSSITLIILIKNWSLLLRTLGLYWVSTCLVAIFLFIYVSYLDMFKNLHRKYRVNSTKDYLTGLNNVRQFHLEFNRLTKNISADMELALLFIDIDHFKLINDRYGHQNGDRILEDLGRILLINSKHSDVVSRNGGEEFSVILVDCPKSQVLKVAERIRREVESHQFILLNGQPVNLTISIGIAMYPDPDREIQNLISRADAALYQAKRSGRNKVILASK